jgi:hypothetical protein
MYNLLEKLRAGEPFTDKDRDYNNRALVSTLKQIHDELDVAVLEAYGWGDLVPLLDPPLTPPSKGGEPESPLIFKGGQRGDLQPLTTSTTSSSNASSPSTPNAPKKNATATSAGSAPNTRPPINPPSPLGGPGERAPTREQQAPPASRTPRRTRHRTRRATKVAHPAQSPARRHPRPAAHPRRRMDRRPSQSPIQKRQPQTKSHPRLSRQLD